MGTASRQPWIEVVGLSVALLRAVAADLPQVRIRHRPPARRRAEPRGRRQGPDRPGWGRPALVLVDGTVADAWAEREATWRRWGPDVPVVEVRRATPIARVWLSSGRVAVVELGPGFLAPYLPPPVRDMADECGAHVSQRAPTPPAPRSAERCVLSDE